jgi:hypothetical protein
MSAAGWLASFWTALRRKWFAVHLFHSSGSEPPLSTKGQSVRRHVDDEQNNLKVDPEWEAGLSVGVGPETIRWDGVLCALPPYAGVWSGGALRLPARGFCTHRFFASVHGVRVSPTRPRWTRRVRPSPHAALPAENLPAGPAAPRHRTVHRPWPSPFWTSVGDNFDHTAVGCTMHDRYCGAIACAMS